LVSSLPIAEHWCPSLLHLICSKILVVLWGPICPIYSQRTSNYKDRCSLEKNLGSPVPFAFHSILQDPAH
jgi:hypothetical protein